MYIKFFTYLCNRITMEKDNNKSAIVKQSNEVSIFDVDISKIMQFASIAVNSKSGSKVKPSTGDKVSQDDIMAVILTGMEFGLKPMQSLQLADKLNNDGYLAITKGSVLGLDATTALDNIHIINTTNGRTPFLGVHIVIALLIKHNIDITVLLDYTPLYNYYRLNKDAKKLYFAIEDIEDNEFQVKPEYFVYRDANTQAQIQEAAATNKTAIMREKVGMRCAVKLTRKGRSPIYYCFSTIDATNEGVYPGIDKFGNQIDGQSTWIKYTRPKLMKTAITRAARIIADDILNGIYTDVDLDYFVASGTVSKKDSNVFEETEVII